MGTRVPSYNTRLKFPDQPGVVAPLSRPSYSRSLRQENHEFKASLVSIVRPCLKK